MIVRERPNEFVMIEQHRHAQVSGDLMKFLKEDFIQERKALESIIFAVYQHDCGWIPADAQPFWNDKDLSPFEFTNFPTALKAMIYSYGINEVAKSDVYAGLLCSEHYTRFLIHDKSAEAQAFVKSEGARQEKLIETLTSFDSALFEFHYGLLQLFDNLSLFLCLNEPGRNDHPFFRSGIPLSPVLGLKEKLNVRWLNERLVQIESFPFEKVFKVTLKQKTVQKKDIFKKGLMESYVEAPFEEIDFNIAP